MRLCIVPVLLLTLIFTATSHAQKNSSQLYAYIERSTTTSLVIVDPTVSMTQEIARYDYPVPTDWHVHSLILNEFNSELWSLAVLYQGYGNVMLYSANLKTGFTRELIRGGTYNPEIAWSPDGQKIAFISSNKNIHRPGFDVYIYDLSIDELKALTVSNVIYAGLSWSSDSTEIATFSHYCQVLEYCGDETNSILHIFDVKTGLATERLVLPQKFRLPCDPIFSPQDDFVAFTSHCDRYIVGWYFPSDIYVYNRSAHLLNRVTTLSDKSENLPSFYGVYDYIWLAEQILLAGSDYRVIMQEEGHQLLTYEIGGEVTILANELGAGFEEIPPTGEILLRSRSPEFQINTDIENDPIETFSIQNTDLQEAENISDKVEQISFPLTTPLVWSPDHTKAYGFLLNEEGYSSYPTTEIVFFDGLTYEVKSYPLTLSEEGKPTIIPAGWVSSEALP